MIHRHIQNMVILKERIIFAFATDALPLNPKVKLTFYGLLSKVNQIIRARSLAHLKFS